MKNAIGKTVHHDFHSKIICPITSIWASDDEIATERNVEDLLKLYLMRPQNARAKSHETWA